MGYMLKTKHLHMYININLFPCLGVGNSLLEFVQAF